MNDRPPEIITHEPTDPAEDAIVIQCKVNPKTYEAVTVFLAPPGTTIGVYKGATMKGVLVAAAKAAAEEAAAAKAAKAAAAAERPAKRKPGKG